MIYYLINKLLYNKKKQQTCVFFSRNDNFFNSFLIKRHLKCVFVILIYNFFKKYLIDLVKRLSKTFTWNSYQYWDVFGKIINFNCLMSIICINVLYIKTVYKPSAIVAEKWHFVLFEVIITGSRVRYLLSELWSFSLKTFAVLYFGIVCLRYVYPLYTIQK